jgi:hypothetical protein
LPSILDHSAACAGLDFAALERAVGLGQGATPRLIGGAALCEILLKIETGTVSIEQ